jgi:hypothetical protein
MKIIIMRNVVVIIFMKVLDNRKRFITFKHQSGK